MRTIYYAKLFQCNLIYLWKCSLLVNIFFVSSKHVFMIIYGSMVWNCTSFFMVIKELRKKKPKTKHKVQKNQKPKKNINWFIRPFLAFKFTVLDNNSVSKQWILNRVFQTNKSHVWFSCFLRLFSQIDWLLRNTMFIHLHANIQHRQAKISILIEWRLIICAHMQIVAFKSL